MSEQTASTELAAFSAAQQTANLNSSASPSGIASTVNSSTQDTANSVVTTTTSTSEPKDSGAGGAPTKPSAGQDPLDGAGVPAGHADPFTGKGGTPWVPKSDSVTSFFDFEFRVGIDSPTAETLQTFITTQSDTNLALHFSKISGVTSVKPKIRGMDLSSGLNSYGLAKHRVELEPTFKIEALRFGYQGLTLNFKILDHLLYWFDRLYACHTSILNKPKTMTITRDDDANYIRVTTASDLGYFELVPSISFPHSAPALYDDMFTSLSRYNIADADKVGVGNLVQYYCYKTPLMETDRLLYDDNFAKYLASAVSQNSTERWFLQFVNDFDAYERGTLLIDHIYINFKKTFNDINFVTGILHGSRGLIGPIVDPYWRNTIQECNIFSERTNDQLTSDIRKAITVRRGDEGGFKANVINAMTHRAAILPEDLVRAEVTSAFTSVRINFSNTSTDGLLAEMLGGLIAYFIFIGPTSNDPTNMYSLWNLLYKFAIHPKVGNHIVNLWSRNGSPISCADLRTDELHKKPVGWPSPSREFDRATNGTKRDLGLLCDHFASLLMNRSSPVLGYHTYPRLYDALRRLDSETGDGGDFFTPMPGTVFKLCGGNFFEIKYSNRELIHGRGAQAISEMIGLGKVRTDQEFQELCRANNIGYFDLTRGFQSSRQCSRAYAITTQFLYTLDPNGTSHILSGSMTTEVDVQPPEIVESVLPMAIDSDGPQEISIKNEITGAIDLNALSDLDDDLVATLALMAAEANDGTGSQSDAGTSAKGKEKELEDVEEDRSESAGELLAKALALMSDAERKAVMSAYEPVRKKVEQALGDNKHILYYPWSDSNGVDKYASIDNLVAICTSLTDIIQANDPRGRMWRIVLNHLTSEANENFDIIRMLNALIKRLAISGLFCQGTGQKDEPPYSHIGEAKTKRFSKTIIELDPLAGIRYVVSARPNGPEQCETTMYPGLNTLHDDGQLGVWRLHDDLSKGFDLSQALVSLSNLPFDPPIRLTRSDFVPIARELNFLNSLVNAADYLCPLDDRVPIIRATRVSFGQGARFYLSSTNSSRYSIAITQFLNILQTYPGELKLYRQVDDGGHTSTDLWTSDAIGFQTYGPVKRVDVTVYDSIVGREEYAWLSGHAPAFTIPYLKRHWKMFTHSTKVDTLPTLQSDLFPPVLETDGGERTPCSNLHQTADALPVNVISAMGPAFVPYSPVCRWVSVYRGGE